MTHIPAGAFLTLAECDRKVFLEHNGDPSLRLPPTPYQRWIMGQGQAFERDVVAGFDVQRPAYPAGRLETGFHATLELMQRGVPYIYQGVLQAADLIGLPDLLEQVDGPSRLGGWHYRPIDIKLATRVHPEHRLQMMVYIRLLELIQGVRPDGSLFLRLPPDQRAPDRLYHAETVTFNETLFAEKLEEVRKLIGGYEPLPFISSTCNGCEWREHCLPIAEAAEDVSLLPGMTRQAWRGLREQGLGTLRAIAGATPKELQAIKGIGKKRARKYTTLAQAFLEERAIPFEKLMFEASQAPIFFDVESVPGEGIIYLMGTLIVEGGEARFEYDLAESREDEAAMWRSFLDRMERLDGLLYHYGAYERTAICQLADRYGEGERADDLLDRMIDLRRILIDSVALPLRGYSLKDVAPWLGFEWTGETQAADDSMLEYIRWLEDGDRRRLERILRYNEDDCRATLAVYEWLRELAGR